MGGEQRVKDSREYEATKTKTARQTGDTVGNLGRDFVRNYNTGESSSDKIIIILLLFVGVLSSLPSALPSMVEFLLSTGDFAPGWVIISAVPGFKSADISYYHKVMQGLC